jgi:hypothetical protein
VNLNLNLTGSTGPWPEDTGVGVAGLEWPDIPESMVTGGGARMVGHPIHPLSGLWSPYQIAEDVGGQEEGAIGER